MKWIKKGLIFCANGQREWMSSHIQNPYAVDIGGEMIRIFFTTRPKPKDSLYTSCVAYIDVAKKNIKQVINIAEHPVLSSGKKGAFDEYGTMPGAVIKRDNSLWLYYVGWTRMCSVPYSWSIGLAISYDMGITFSRYGNGGPILGKSYNDPYLQNGPTSVLLVEGVYHMFYSSGIGWLVDKEKVESQYVLRHARSYDGVSWIPDKNYCVAMKFDDESQTSPTVFQKDGVYHMLFPYRHSYDFRNSVRGYRIGYASSSDLIHWERDDSLAGIDVSEEGWDSEMVCYPHVACINDKYIMFYCGNGFGKGGIGYAELEME